MIKKAGIALAVLFLGLVEVRACVDIGQGYLDDTYLLSNPAPE